MRTTVNLDPDVLAVLNAEQRRTGETKGQVVGRLVRRALSAGAGERVSLPTVSGRLRVDVSDVSRLLVELDGADARAGDAGGADPGFAPSPPSESAPTRSRR